MSPLILRLDISGKPITWIPWQTAVCLYCRDMIAWTAGEHSFSFRGGINRRSGERSIVDINSIIAIKRSTFRKHLSRTIPPLTNRELFLRRLTPLRYPWPSRRLASRSRSTAHPAGPGCDHTGCTGGRTRTGPRWRASHRRNAGKLSAASSPSPLSHRPFRPASPGATRSSPSRLCAGAPY